MTKLMFAAAAALCLTAGSALADGPDFSVMDQNCKSDQNLMCTTTASLKTTTNTIEDVAGHLQMVLPVSVTVDQLIEMNGWTGANPTTTVIPANVRFRVM